MNTGRIKSLAQMAPRHRAEPRWIVTLRRDGKPDRTLELAWLGSRVVVPDYFDRFDDVYAFASVDFQTRTAVAVYARTDPWMERLRA